MRQSFVAGNLRLIGLLLLCSTAIVRGGDTLWFTGNTPDVTAIGGADETLILGAPGDLTFPLDRDEVRVTAATADVVVTMTTGDVTIQSFTGGNSHLYVTADAGQSVTFLLANNLTFEGNAPGPLVPDLLITFSGEGEIIFDIDGGETLTLQQRAGGGGRVQAYLQMNTTTGTPTLRFQRDPLDASADDNVEVVVEGGSILSYLANVAQPSSTEDGVIEFDTTNATGSGRMLLTIGELGAVIVRARQMTDPGAASFDLADINPAVPAGGDAQFRVVNTNAATSGSLLVQNSNNTLGELIWDPWCNLQVRQNPPFGNFNGVVWGFVIGSYGTLDIGDDSYFDFVSLTGTVCPNPPIADAQSRVKPRNPSALFTDGQPNPDFTAPRINIGDTAAVFFRSGVDNEGNIRTLADPNPFTIDPNNRTPGAGFVVFDIEGPLDIVGQNSQAAQRSKFELLSLEVDPTGGPLFVGGSETIFPLRTFAKVSGQEQCTGKDETVFLSYNNASFLNNGRADLFDVSFNHTDQNHHVFENNDVSSEPAYIGGETWALKPCIPKPKYAFINSRFNIHTSVAITGVDLLTPNGDGPEDPSNCYANKSQFVFYGNGKVIDKGNGRNMILGTFVGSTACDGCTVICKDAQLDVMQTSTCDVDPCAVRHSLCLSTTQNDGSITEGIPAGVGLTNQFSIQTIYLGNNSNISVGTNSDQGTSMEVTVTEQFNFPLTTCPELLINGNFFSFETRGGENGIPSTSNVTGQGGIFVDMNGTFSIGSDLCGYRANIGTMVTQSRNGVVDLPKNRVFFDPRVGIAAWNLNLNDPAQRVIIPSNRCLSEYNLNWMFVEKDYNIFSPYIVDCFDVCSCPEVTQMNVSGIPTVDGTVQQLQIQGSRLGDPAHIKVRGGNVGELVMLVGYNSGEAPVAVVVLEHSGKVGLGSKHRNVDSLQANIQLGVNGVNLILNGDEGTAALNEDVIINNICSLLPGPDATADGRLRITSDSGTTLCVTKDGVLDLSAFSEGQAVEFGGNLRVIFEPGATVIYGNQADVGPTLRFVENATCEFQPVTNLNGIFGDDLTGTDTVRVKFAGTGMLEFADCSRADIPRDAFVGIESLPACDIQTTFVRLRLTDSGEFHIGDTDCRTPGGVLQLGNTTDLLSPLVTFSLILDGPEACFEIGPQGFLGAGTGIVEKYATGHDSWLIAPTANLQKVSFDLANGKFRHAQLYAGDDERSALFALCDSVNGNGLTVFDFFTAELFGNNNRLSATLLSNTTVLGGGSFIAVSTAAGPFNPVVGMQNGFIDANYTAGILASKPLFMRSFAFDVDAFTAQTFIRLHDVLELNPTTNRAVAALSDLRNEVRIGFVDTGGMGGEGLIARLDVERIVGKTQQTVIQRHAKELGATQVALLPISEAGGTVPRPLRVSIEAGN